MKKLNNYQSLGLLFIVISLISTRFGLLHNIVEGFCVGIGIVLILIGMVANKHDISKFRNYKMNFFKRGIGK